MKPIILLSAVLLLSKVIGHDDVNFTEDEDETELSISDKKPIVEADVCGDTNIVITNVKREDTIFDDEDTAYDNVDEFPNLDKILGGNYATYGEFPWTVNLLYFNQHSCGGSIISEFWVITAAHCVIGRTADQLTVRVGNHLLYEVDSHEKTHSVANIIKHEEFRSGYAGADIALVKIKPTWDGRGIRYNDYIQPICLPYFYERPLVTTHMEFSGWGRTSPGQKPPALQTSGSSWMLKKTILPVISSARCQQLFGDQVTPNDFCAGYFNGDTDLCRGDSGGPLAYRTEGSYVLFGVAALSSRCPLPNNPIIFTTVALYRGWIDNTIRLNGNGSELTMPRRRVPVTSTPAK